MMKIYVVAHKKIQYKLPKNYEFIQVGNIKEKYYDCIDNTGDNISYKNDNYCELTALYWIWKNDKLSEIVGLCHYRRYFTKSLIFKWKKSFLKEKDISKILNKYDIIVPKKMNWKNTTVREYYSKYNGFDKDLIATMNVIEKIYPEYKDSFQKILNSNKAYYYNMFITNKKNMDSYCKWLFDILNEVEKNIDISKYNVQEARVFGYISEILLNVWVEFNKLKYKEINVVNTESSIKWRIIQLFKQK